MVIHIGNPQDILVPPVEGVAGGGTAYGWNDGVTGVRNLSPLKGSIDPSEVPTTDLVHVWCMPSTANVGPQEMPRHLETVSSLIVIMLLYVWIVYLIMYYLHIFNYMIFVSAEP